MCCTKGAWTFVISGYLDELQPQLEIKVKHLFCLGTNLNIFCVFFEDLWVFIYRKIRCSVTVMYW